MLKQNYKEELTILTYVSYSSFPIGPRAHLKHIPAALHGWFMALTNFDVALFNLALWASLPQHQPSSDGK